MTSLKNRQQGFTIVELLIVIVVIVILAGFVLNAFSGIQAQARDADRTNDLRVVASQLETYGAKNDGVYPTAANLADGTWVAANLVGLDPDALLDPAGAAYTYTPAPANCDNGATVGDCTSWTLTADLEEDGRGGDDADSNTADESQSSLLN
jgi:prepilin-type N-terminal cleavage/methylation domain-containing protein